MLALIAAVVLAPPMEKRLVYLATNLLVDANVERDLALLGRAKKAGYNGVVLTDSKFWRWTDLPERYKQNVSRLRAEMRRLGMECIAAVAPIGYSNDLLSKDPDLAEGLPVEDAPFRATASGTLTPEDDLKLANGGFEDGANGWAWMDVPGKVCVIDRSEHAEGKASLKMTEIRAGNPESGNARACQPLKVLPHRYYHVSAKVKTQDFDTPGAVNITVLGNTGQSLQHRSLPIQRTMGWTTIDVTFNTLDCTSLNVYFGVWGGRTGSLWWDDLQLEPAGLTNLVRRPGAPFRVTSADGRTVYVEGEDYDGARDPKCGRVAWPGDYDFWHTPPTLTLPAGSRIKPGDLVKVSYCHTALIYDGQATVCLGEPKLDVILAENFAEVKRFVQPDGYLLSHDEIRVGGWDAGCIKTGKTPGALLADNVRKCAAMVRKTDPGKTVYAWSDMFDPNHNAQPKGLYYLLKGDGPWKGAWEGIDKDVVILNWNSDPRVRKASLRFFADRGNRQILAGYYDSPVEGFRGWLSDAADVKGVIGAMYTTWASNYRDLESFAKEF
ncbi:MAG: carbohydrate binding domain-containing protein [Fimbriimonadales bacterium]